MHYSSEMLVEQKTLSVLEVLKLAIGNQQLLDNYLCHNVRSSKEKAYSQSKAHIDFLLSSSTTD